MIRTPAEHYHEPMKSSYQVSEKLKYSVYLHTMQKKEAATPQLKNLNEKIYWLEKWQLFDYQNSQTLIDGLMF